MTIPLVGRMSDQDDGALMLETRTRRPIPNEYRNQDVLPARLAEIERLLINAHPGAQLLFSTGLYNCGGLIFGSRRVWIEPDQFRKILADDGYRPVTAPPKPGDVVLYGTPEKGVDHVGVVHHMFIAYPPQRPKPEVWVRSKWGEGGEYVHEIHDVPKQFGEPLQLLRFR